MAETLQGNQIHEPMLGIPNIGPTDTIGYAYMPVVTGEPTSVPLMKAGWVPFCFEKGENKLWIYNDDGGYSGWTYKRMD